MSNTITGKERFSLKYLCEYELKHVSITLTRDDFIMPIFRKRNGGVNFDFFFFQNRQFFGTEKIEEIIEPFAEKEIDHKKVSMTFLTDEEI